MKANVFVTVTVTDTFGQRIIKCLASQRRWQKGWAQLDLGRKVWSQKEKSQLQLGAFCQVQQLSVNFRSKQIPAACHHRKILSTIKLQHLTAFYCERIK